MNHLSRIVKPLAGTTLLILTLCLATGQGSLDPPPGAPAPSMKTLQELWDKIAAAQTEIASVQADVTAVQGDVADVDSAVAAITVDDRTPISSVPIVLSAPGSYYLTGNLQFSNPTGNAITITADNVTLDFNGFTLSSTPSVTGRGVYIQADQTVIHNGLITGNTTIANIGTTWDVTPAGFLRGIFRQAGNASRVERMTVTACRASGISLGFDSILSDCITRGNGSYGASISWGSTATNCISQGNGDAGILGLESAFIGCSARQNKGDGISVSDGIITRCLARENGDYGLDCSSGVITNSLASGNATGQIKPGSSTRDANNPTP